MLPSKRHHSSSLKVTYEANYDCDNQISKKRNCCEKMTTKTRKIKPLKIPCRLSNSQSDAIVPYTHQTLHTIDSNPNNYDTSQQCNNTLYNVPVNIEKSTQVCSSKLGTTSDNTTNNTTIVVEGSRPTESKGPAQHKELLTGCNYDALYDIREMLSRKVDNEVDKFRSSLSSAISEEFDWIAQQQQQQQLHGGQNSGITDNSSNLSKGAQYMNQETMLAPNEELALDKHDSGFIYNELEPSTDDCLISDNCVSVQHQMDHYVMRLLTASLIINNSLKNKIV